MPPRRTLALALALALLVALSTPLVRLVNEGYVAVSARVELVDARDVERVLLCDLEDALDIVSAASPGLTETQAWAAAQLRADVLGWSYDPAGWIKGRELFVRLRWDGVRLAISTLYLTHGMLAASMDEASVSVCGGPVLRPFPSLTTLLAEFDAFRGTARDNCRDADKTYVLAAYRVLCAWLDLC